MKKVYAVIGCILVVILTVAIVIGVLFYTGKFDKDILSQQNVYVYTTESGLKYTEAKWDWRPAEFKDIINYVDTSELGTQKVTLHLEGNNFCDVSIPLNEYVYDYGKTIWAVDGSYMVRVIGDASLDTLSSLAGIDDGVALNQTTICTADGKKGQRTITTLVDDFAIIANVYYGDENYSILRDSLVELNESYIIEDVEYSDDYVELERISYSGQFVSQVIFQDITMEQKKYIFEKGVLWCSYIFDDLDDIKNEYLCRLCAMSGEKIEETYTVDGMFYAKSGDFYLGLISYNSNTTIVMLGDGDESKCNIVSTIHNLR